MSKVFFPDKSVFVEASCPPHPPNTRYKVSVGKEKWGDNEVDVFKVQMEYDRVLAGRRSPSYPVGTDDATKVQTALNKMINDLNSL